LNIVLALLFVHRWGLLGLGLAFGLSYLLAAAWALQILHYKLPAFAVDAVIASLWRIGLSSLIMAEVVWAVARVVGANSGSGSILRVVISTIVGAAAYVAMLMVLRSPELDDLVARLRPTKSVATGD
jgi:putative peptidoglycan lipid II flippase